MFPGPSRQKSIKEIRVDHIRGRQPAKKSLPSVRGTLFHQLSPQLNVVRCRVLSYVAVPVPCYEYWSLV
eukprot:8487516-Pyramimonas_sp.AAC.1